MWHWHEGTWFPRSQWPPRGQGPAWAKPGLTTSELPDHRRAKAALQLLGPTEGPTCSGTRRSPGQSCIPRRQHLLLLPGCSSQTLSQGSAPASGSECTCGGVFHRHAPHTRGARTRLTPPRAYLHQVLGWAALAQAGKQRRRRPVSLGPSAGRCQAPALTPSRPLPHSFRGADCPPALSPPPRFLQLVSLMHK